MAETKIKKLIWKRWYMIVLYVFVGLMIIGSLLPDSNNTSNQQTTTPTQNQEVQTPQEISFKLAVWDETEQKNTNNLEIWVRGLGSWYPDLQFGGDSEVIGPFTINGVQEIFVYPEGRDSPEIKIEFTPKKDMISESDRDMIQIEIFDNRINVFGTSIEEFEKEFSY